jgi:hypothetical protein
MTDSSTEKAELQRRLNEIQDKERKDFFAAAEDIWSNYVLPLLKKSRQQFPRGGVNAPVVLTLRHRDGAYRSGLQGGGVWILRWESYQRYINCSGDAEPEEFGFNSLDELMKDADHQEVFSSTLQDLRVSFSIYIRSKTHPSLSVIRTKCIEIQTACQSLMIPSVSVEADRIKNINWTAWKEKLNFSQVQVDKVLLRTKLQELTALIEGLPSAPEVTKVVDTPTAATTSVPTTAPVVTQTVAAKEEEKKQEEPAVEEPKRGRKRTRNENTKNQEESSAEAEAENKGRKRTRRTK